MKTLVFTSTVHVVDDAQLQLEDLLTYLHAHCADATLASTSAHFAYHPNTVGAYCRRKLGKSFTELLHEVRLEESRRLLAESREPVESVALLCGYQSLSSFYRAFRKRYGEPPRSYAEHTA